MPIENTEKYAEQRYDIGEDVHRRLDGSIVRYKSRPVHLSWRDGMQLIAVDLLTNEQIRVDANDVDLDISSPPIGYVNDKKYAWYFSRVPMRMQKQGLIPRHCVYLREDGSAEAVFQPMGHWNVHTSAIARCILNEYPELGRAVQNIVDGKVISMAFTRRFSLESLKDGVLYLNNRGNHIGYYMVEDKSFVLPSEENYNNYANILRSHGEIKP